MISEERLLAIASWAHDLTEAERERARKGIVERAIPVDGYLVHRGDRLDQWTGVVSGLMKLGSITMNGKAITLAGLPAGCWFGEGSLIKNEARQYDVVAVRPAVIAAMNLPTFFWLFENSVGFNRVLVRQLNERLGQFMSSTEQARMLDAAGRVARTLAWLVNPVINPMASDHIEISQENVGQLAGISRQIANKVLQELERKGLIRNERGGITFLNVAGLRNYGE